MIIGIYSGKTKPTDLNAFLTPFVNELDIMECGLPINGHKINVKLRCFICDSPARAFVKGMYTLTYFNNCFLKSDTNLFQFTGVAYFNAQNGCQKCTVSGEYSYVSHCNFFPQANNRKRTDLEFRNRTYGSHHKIDSPLLRLPIDMIADFPVGDSLHLIDLGLMKRCLLGWRDGKLGNYRCKWSAKDTLDISQLLVKIKLPREIHRSVRGLDCLSHWKGLEFRSFLYYIGIVVLKPFLPSDVYEHFLTLFCAVTICSSDAHANLVELAHTMLIHYVECYAKIYGQDYITSNVHNLNHLVE